MSKYDYGTDNEDEKELDMIQGFTR